MAGNFKEIQSIKKRNFLNAFARTGRIDRSADVVGMDSSLHYHWKKDDTEYAEAFKEAREIAAERLEDEATRRAYEGVLKPVFQGGKEVGVIREYSDTLLIFLLKGNIPDKFKERLEHSGKLDLLKSYQDVNLEDV
jgi:hypothetical protein